MPTIDPNSNILTAQVPIQQHGMRLDQAAVELFLDYSRNRLATWIKEGRLTLDGKQVKPREKALAGALLRLEVDDEPAVDWQPQEMPLDVLYEDEHILGPKTGTNPNLVWDVPRDR